MPRYLIYYRQNEWSTFPFSFYSLGLIHLMKWQSDEINSSISIFIYYLNLAPKNFSVLDGFLRFYISLSLLTISFPHRVKNILEYIAFLDANTDLNISPDISDLFLLLNPKTEYSTFLAVWTMVNLSLEVLAIINYLWSLYDFYILENRDSSVPDPNWVLSSNISNIPTGDLSIRSITLLLSL